MFLLRLFAFTILCRQLEASFTQSCPLKEDFNEGYCRQVEMKSGNGSLMPAEPRKEFKVHNFIQCYDRCLRKQWCTAWKYMVNEKEGIRCFLFGKERIVIRSKGRDCDSSNWYYSYLQETKPQFLGRCVQFP